MSDVQLFAVTGSGPERLRAGGTVANIHALPDSLPFGVYTALRTFNHNQFLGLAAHLDRLEQSIALLGWDYTLDQGRLRRALHEVCTAYPRPEARVRIDVLAGPATALGSRSRELLVLAPFTPEPAHLYEEGVRVGLAPRLQRDQPRIKKADFVLARRAYPLGRPDFYEYLLLDEAGCILEGSSSNFYAVSGGRLWTAGNGVLEGITRRIILALAAELGIPQRLETIPLAAVPTLDEAFLSSASRGLIPVVAVAGTTIGSGTPGPLTRRLMAAYADYVGEAVRPAV